MDAIELLRHDHRMVEQLLRDYSAAATDQQRRGVVDIVIRELSKHAALEELMFYPLAKQVLPQGGAEIEEHLAEHLTVKKLLAHKELDKAKQTAPTRPHPHAPDEPPALTMAAPVAAIYDRLRDRLQGRPQT